MITIFSELIKGLLDAGVQGVYGLGSKIVECAADMLRLLGHNMPPVEG